MSIYYTNKLIITMQGIQLQEICIEMFSFKKKRRVEVQHYDR